jgi:hypothetical protein
VPRLRLGGRAIPWLVLLELAQAAQRHWNHLTPGERAHLTALIKKSAGRPGNLTARDKDDVKRLVGKMDVPGMGRDLLPHARRLRRGASRRR